MTTLNLETISNATRLIIVNEAIATGNYKKQMDCVRYLKAAGYVEPVSKKKEAVADWLDAIAQELLQTSSEITEEAIKEANDSLGFGETVVIAPAQIELNLDVVEEKQLPLVEVTTEVVELFAEEATTEAIAVELAPALEAPAVEITATEEVTAEVVEAIAEEATVEDKEEAVIPNSNDLKKIKAIVLMSNDDNEILNWAVDFGFPDTSEDISAAKQFLKDLLVSHGQSADPVKEILDKKPRTGTGKPRTQKLTGDRIICEPEAFVKQALQGSLADYFRKALSRLNGATLDDLTLLFNLNSIKQANPDWQLADIYEAGDVTSVIIKLNTVHGITASKFEQVTEAYLVNRLNKCREGFRCGIEVKGDRYYLILPAGQSEQSTPKAKEKPAKEKKTRAPRITQDAIADQLNDLQAQNQLLMQQLEALKAAQSVTV